jgi:tetratricopeptide (TPR) repeat protein
MSKLLHHFNRLEVACISCQDGVIIWRLVLESQRYTGPLNAIAELATSLSALSVCLSNLGRREEALVAIRESVDLLVGITTTQYSIQDVQLGKSLHNLSLHLSNVGRPEEAISVSLRALNFSRHLNDGDSAVHAHELAHLLHDHSRYLCNLGRYDEGISTIREAIQLRRQLVENKSHATIHSRQLSYSLQG